MVEYACNILLLVRRSPRNEDLPLDVRKVLICESRYNTHTQYMFMDNIVNEW